jgi:hypothetical protein
MFADYIVHSAYSWGKKNVAIVLLPGFIQLGGK